MNIVSGSKHYLSNILLIWLAILFYHTNKYYRSFLFEETKAALIVLALAYTVFGLIGIFFGKHGTRSKGAMFFHSMKKLFTESWRHFREFVENPASSIRLTHEEKTSILFILVKLFFLPIMINFFFGNLGDLQDSWPLLSAGHLNFYELFNNAIYPLLLAAIFLIDTIIFAVGYAIDHPWLKNTIRSVEPTFFGWAVALMCYPPFNQIEGNFVNWYPNNMAFFWSDQITFFFRIALILLLLVYLSGSVFLGFKASNLTNRGIVTTGPYAIIRHPAYISKNLFWWMTVLPFMSLAAFFSLSLWTIIYFMRAITEERHLIKDPDYQAYCKKVKYRFIPFVY
jgi:protein-S-isoprenylcysteine O-methyltransferase Ste14